jgi:methyl coenzyme M reductase gamma subunit
MKINEDLVDNWFKDLLEFRALFSEQIGKPLDERVSLGNCLLQDYTIPRLQTLYRRK